MKKLRSHRCSKKEPKRKEISFKRVHGTILTINCKYPQSTSKLTSNSTFKNDKKYLFKGFLWKVYSFLYYLERYVEKRLVLAGINIT